MATVPCGEPLAAGAAAFCCRASAALALREEPLRVPGTEWLQPPATAHPGFPWDTPSAAAAGAPVSGQRWSQQDAGEMKLRGSLPS